MGKRKRRQIPRARVASERALGVQEASAVGRLSSGAFLVVDDEKGVFRWSDEGGAVALEAGRGLSDLEGLCLSSDGRTAWLLAERDGGVWRHEVSGDELSAGARIGRLPSLNDRKNHGWEGIAFVEAGRIDSEAVLVAVHQKKPRRLALFNPLTLGEKRRWSLPKDAKKTLGDLNDVTVHPETGHLVVVSGEEGVLGELAVRKGELETVAFHRVDHDDDDVPEGITYDREGRLWLVTDGEGWLREIVLER